MSGHKCDACNGPIKEGSQARYCSRPCRTRGARFGREYAKTELYLDRLQNLTEYERLDNMITRMKKRSIAEAKRLREAGRINDALKTLTECENNLVCLTGKQQGLHRKMYDLYDIYLDLRRRHGMFIEEDES